MDLEKSSLTFWSAVEGWCDKSIATELTHDSSFLVKLFGHFFLFPLPFSPNTIFLEK